MFQGQLLHISFWPNQGIFFQEGARNTSGGGPGEHVVFFCDGRHLVITLNTHNPSPGVPIPVWDFYARGPVIPEISWNQWQTPSEH